MFNLEYSTLELLLYVAVAVSFMLIVIIAILLARRGKYVAENEELFDENEKLIAVNKKMQKRIDDFTKKQTTEPVFQTNQGLPVAETFNQTLLERGQIMEMVSQIVKNTYAVNELAKAVQKEFITRANT